MSKNKIVNFHISTADYYRYIRNNYRKEMQNKEKEENEF